MSPLRPLISIVENSTLNSPSLFLALNANGNATLLIIVSIALIFLIIGSSFFSSAETAFSTVNIIRLKSFVEEKKRGAKKALWIAENYDRTLTTILVGNNFVNIAATTLATVLFTRIIPNDTVANIVNTFAMTIIILIFGEIFPKCLAKENAEKISLKYAGVLFILMKILYPIVFLFMKLRQIMSRKASTSETPTVTGSELETIIDTMEEEGEIDTDDAKLMHGMLDTNSRTIYDIMVPRVDMIAIDYDSTIAEMKEIFFEYKFSRVPVFKEDKDHIIGVLSERDFFTALLKKEKIDLDSMVSKPLYVSKSMKVDDLIRKMQTEKKHFAIVSDEYGGTSGIVTMEDAIEVITGEIYDEHDDLDDIVEEIKKIDDNTYIIDSEMPIDDLFELLELGKAPDSRYSNIGGFLYGMAEELPTVGQQFDYTTKVYEQDEDGMIEEVPIDIHFIILEVVERRIKTIKMVIDNPDLKKSLKIENNIENK